jgi:hypothetical protein
VAESGTVEEIDQFVAADKPAMLYFSRRPIDPNAINLSQQRKLRAFKTATYKSALTGGFAGLVDLRQTLLRDLLSQIRRMKDTTPVGGKGQLDEALRITELIVAHRQHKITPKMFQKYREEILDPRRRSKTQTMDPVPAGEVGPNGHRIGYTQDGDKVEWLPDDENPGQEWPMILRRNDRAILEAANEFTDVIWYDRKLVMQQNLRHGTATIDPEIYKGMLAAMRAAEKKYGKKRLRDYYHNDFEWGMLNGKLSALRWVLGDDWDMLDT